MGRFRRTQSLVTLAGLGFISCRAADPDGSIHTTARTRSLQELLMMIRYRNERGRLRVSQAASSSDPVKDELLAQHVNVLATQLTRNQTRELLDDPDIDFIEYDAPVKLQGEVRPYALSFIQGLATQNALPAISNPGTCSDDAAFKIAILDSGIEASHPDINCLENDSCIGRTFGLNTTISWSEPLDDHGTMVAGIIAATRNNNIGITGVVNNVCLIVGRIFVNEQDEGRLSDVLASVAWAAEQGARVINLSLGGDYTSWIGRELYAQLYESGKVLVIAAAGNDGTSQPMFPASYSSVISVAAVTPELTRALFSQYNPYIDFTAPGVGILSTARLEVNSTSIFTVEPVDSDSELAMVGILMGDSPTPQAEEGILTECTNFGMDLCEGDGGHVCLIQRGENLYYEKAVNCQESGGIAAIIYDTEPGPPLNSTLGSFASDIVTIPVIGISKSDGLLLVDRHVGESVAFQSAPGYRFADGTSFSAPYVAGSIAAVWQACPVCENSKIRQCFEDTALDLGSEGRDNKFGYGLIQLEAAYQCVAQARCCDADATFAPTVAPTTTNAPSCSPVATNAPISSSTPSPTSDQLLSLSNVSTSRSPTLAPTAEAVLMPTTSTSDAASFNSMSWSVKVWWCLCAAVGFLLL